MRKRAGAQPLAELGGSWTVLGLGDRRQMARLKAQVIAARERGASWDLRGVDRLDEVAARWLLHHWLDKMPEQAELTASQREVFRSAARKPGAGTRTEPKTRAFSPAELPGLRQVAALGDATLRFFEHVIEGVGLIGQLALDLLRLLANPALGPWREISANVYQIGFRALGITALVGFLIGIVLSYLTSQQLARFGGGPYIVNLLGISIIRELGPMLAAILVAGRSGSAITAQIGVMRVNEELDAMEVIGMPRGFRLVLPKVIALAIAMPLLVLWTDMLALAGGMLAAALQLDVSPHFFVRQLPGAVNVANIWLGLGKGAVFGMLIAITACLFGLRIAPNTRSLGEGTTNSVVTAIILVILADAIFAIVFKDVGI
ncbi:MAG: ABC transporter permease [Candidatus Protistobacter heckmanni]|nr:ABC transporter permease [Candidatus Protistobacter heckmanni]